MAKKKYNVIREEMLQVASNVAQEKNIDQDSVFSAMEQALEKAARVKYGQEIDIRISIDRSTGDIKLNSYLEVVENVEEEFQSRQILLEEKVHYDYFDKQIVENRVRPTIMSPLWKIFGSTLGALTSRLGENYVHACTESVEEVIVAHYKEQLEFLEANGINNSLKARIKKFCEDEDKHKHFAQSKHKSENFGLNLFKGATKIGTKIAISISKKF